MKKKREGEGEKVGREKGRERKWGERRGGRERRGGGEGGNGKWWKCAFYKSSVQREQNVFRNQYIKLPF